MYWFCLQEMLKYTHNGVDTQELQEAVNTILSVLKYVNDIMHQVAITGYPVSTYAEYSVFNNNK